MNNLWDLNRIASFLLGSYLPAAKQHLVISKFSVSQ